jgi:hypothetical protein
MPFLIPLVAAAAGALASAAIGGTIGAVVGAVVVAGTGFALNSLFGAKPMAGGMDIDTRRRAIRQNITSSVGSIPVVYGTMRVGGPVVYINTSGTDNKYLHQVMVLSEGEVSDLTTVYLDGIVSTASRYSGKVNTRKKVGTDTQTSFSGSVGEVPPGWTSAHRLLGLAYLYTACLLSDNVFTQIPGIEVQGDFKLVYDPRDLTTKFSKTPALIIRDYLTNTRYGKGIPEAQIDDTSFNTAANYCEQTVTYPDGNTGARYECNGVVFTDRTIRQNIQELLTSCRGYLIYTGGLWKLKIDKAETATFTFNEDNIIGSWSIARGGKRAKKNQLEVQFINASKGYEPDMIIVSDTAGLAEDNNTILTARYDLPYTTHRGQAMHIGYQNLKQSRQDITVSFRATVAALEVEVGDVVYLTHTTPAWVSKLFRVTRLELENNDEVSVTAIEYDADVYDTSTLTDTDESDGSGLELPQNIQPPGSPVVSEELITAGGTLRTRVTLTWAESSSPFVTHYTVQYQLPGETTYTNFGNVDTASAVLNDVSPGAYIFRVRAVNSVGVASDWASTTQEIFGTSGDPSDITGFVLNAISDQAHLQWDQAPDIDVQTGGYIRIRHTSSTSSATWENSNDLGPALSGISTNAVLPLLDGTYFIKAIDVSGNESPSAASIIVTAASVITTNQVKTGQQDTSFSGTKTNMFVDSSDNTLRLDSSTLWDSITGNIDDWVGNIDDANGSGIASSGVYQFVDPATSLEYFDLGAVYTSRVTINAESLVFDTASVWDNLYPSIDIDSWPGLIDGDSLSGTDYTIQISTTTDDPSGAPTWSSYQAFSVGDFSLRACRNKLVVSNSITSNNIKFSDLGITIDHPDRTERVDDQPVGSTGITFIYTLPFFARPEPSIVIQGSTSGDTPIYTHVQSGGKYTGLTVQIRNNSTGVARTCDIFASGY